MKISPNFDQLELLGAINYIYRVDGRLQTFSLNYPGNIPKLSKNKPD